MSWKNSLLCAVLGAVLWSPAAAADKGGHVGKTVEVKIAPQAWQVRRAETAKMWGAIVSSQGKDQKALDRFDALLTAFEKDPVSITPMEAMDIYGVFYVPREGATHIGDLLKMVSAFAILGWYDALRFADESGRAEIIHNEAFFRRAFELGGEAGTRQLIEFMTNQPKAAEESVKVGARFAAAVADQPHYDVRWPSAYGLARMNCALEGAKTCPPPPALPKEQWKDAFADAVARVSHYYRINEKK